VEGFIYPLRRQKIIISIAPMASSAQIDILIEASSSDEEDATPSLLSPAEQHYADNSRTMLSLATMSIGAVGEDGLPLLDPDGAPWNKVAKKQIKPGSDLLRLVVVIITMMWSTLFLCRLPADAIIASSSNCLHC
jgi:hypothetical protein